MPLAELPSACPYAPVRSGVRLDPYWAGIWTVGSTARWRSLSTMRRREALGLAVRKAQERAWSQQEAIEQILAARRQRRLAHVAAVNLWRTMTTEQLAAMTGTVTLARRRSLEVDLLFAAGLVQKGRFVLDDAKGRRAPGLLRPDPMTRLEPFTSRLSYREWVGLTAGQPWRWGSQFDRHNLIATELALRVAEHCGVAAVFGEALAALDVLTRSGEPALAARAADAVLVRRDGLRIALEVTAHAGVTFAGKVSRWARTLAQDRSGSLVVVFVDAAHPDLDGQARCSLENGMRGKLVRAIARDLDAVLARVWERMFVVSWRDWFPGPGQVLRAFPGLPVRRPAGVGPGATTRWEGLDLLDPFGYELEPGPHEAALLVNANAVLGQPCWLRSEQSADQPDLDAAVLATHGVTELPVLPPVKEMG